MTTSETKTSLLSAIYEQMVQIPAGKIDMHDDRTNLKWTVQVETFLLAKFPVTQKIYQGVTKINPSTFKGDDLPVETITWSEAISFCNDLSSQFNLRPCYHFDQWSEEIFFDPAADGFRLPTEAEWEYACKAGSHANRYGALAETAWYKDNAGNKTHAVGQKKPNAWGLYDMLGNVWEWCSDLYDTDVYGSYRIFRGGGFCDEERSVMATTRRRSHPLKFRIEDLGFRIAKNK